MSEFDEEAAKELLKDNYGEGYSVESVDLSLTFSVDENLEGNIEMEQVVELIYSANAQTEAVQMYNNIIVEGISKVKEGDSYTITFNYEGITNMTTPSVGYEKEDEYEEEEATINCTLTAESLICENDDEIEMSFTKE